MLGHTAYGNIACLWKWLCWTEETLFLNHLMENVMFLWCTKHLFFRTLCYVVHGLAKWNTCKWLIRNAIKLRKYLCFCYFFGEILRQTVYSLTCSPCGMLRNHMGFFCINMYRSPALFFHHHTSTWLCSSWIHYIGFKWAHRPGLIYFSTYVF